VRKLLATTVFLGVLLTAAPAQAVCWWGNCWGTVVWENRRVNVSVKYSDPAWMEVAVHGKTRRAVHTDCTFTYVTDAGVTGTGSLTTRTKRGHRTVYFGWGSVVTSSNWRCTTRVGNQRWG
jgi:hypothetical protein